MSRSMLGSQSAKVHIKLFHLWTVASAPVGQVVLAHLPPVRLLRRPTIVTLPTKLMRGSELCDTVQAWLNKAEGAQHTSLWGPDVQCGDA